MACADCGGNVAALPDGTTPRRCRYCTRQASPELSDLSARLSRALNSVLAERDGTARQCQWRAEDGWLIVYTTSRVEGGPHHGKFVAMAYKPNRRKDPTSWRQVYARPFATRKAAKARATALYYQHSPKAKARHGIA